MNIKHTGELKKFFAFVYICVALFIPPIMELGFQFCHIMCDFSLVKWWVEYDNKWKCWCCRFLRVSIAMVCELLCVFGLNISTNWYNNLLIHKELNKLGFIVIWMEMQRTLKQVQSRRYENTNRREELHSYRCKFWHWICYCWGSRFAVSNFVYYFCFCHEKLFVIISLINLYSIIFLSVGRMCIWYVVIRKGEKLLFMKFSQKLAAKIFIWR